MSTFRHLHMSTYIHILSKNLPWVSSDCDPVGAFFSICVGLTHFSPRPHPTVLFLKHMCGGGRGINECLPRGDLLTQTADLMLEPCVPLCYICLQVRVHISVCIYMHFFFILLQASTSSVLKFTSWLCLGWSLLSWRADCISISAGSNTSQQHPEVELFLFPFFQWPMLADEMVSLHKPRAHWGPRGVRHIWANRLLMSCLHEPLIIAWERKSGGGRRGGGCGGGSKGVPCISCIVWDTAESRCFDRRCVKGGFSLWWSRNATSLILNNTRNYTQNDVHLHVSITQMVNGQNISPRLNARLPDLLDLISFRLRLNFFFFFLFFDGSIVMSYWSSSFPFNTHENGI